MIGTRPIKPHPILIACARVRRTDVRVRVVPVNAPSGEYPFREAILARSPDVIHHFVLPTFLNRLLDPRSDVVQSLVPTNARPFACASSACALERIEDAIRLVD